MNLAQFQQLKREEWERIKAAEEIGEQGPELEEADDPALIDAWSKVAEEQNED